MDCLFTRKHSIYIDRIIINTSSIRAVSALMFPFTFLGRYLRLINWYDILNLWLVMIKILFLHSMFYAMKFQINHSCCYKSFKEIHLYHLLFIYFYGSSKGNRTPIFWETVRYACRYTIEPKVADGRRFELLPTGSKPVVLTITLTVHIWQTIEDSNFY